MSPLLPSNGVSTCQINATTILLSKRIMWSGCVFVRCLHASYRCINVFIVSQKHPCSWLHDRCRWHCMSRRKSMCTEYELQTPNGICHYACLFYVCVYIVRYMYIYMHTYIHSVVLSMYVYIYIHIINMWSPHAPDSTHYKYLYICIYTYIWSRVPCSYPPTPTPMVWVPQVAPLPFYLQAIGSISEVHPRIC